MIVYKINKNTAKEIEGKEYTDGIKFNPILDADDNYILSMEELKTWNKNLHFPIEEDLEPIEFNPVVVDLFPKE